MNQPLVVLDTPTLYYRSYYAIPVTIQDSSGMPVNAVRGVLDTIAGLVELLGSSRIIAAMDSDWRPAFRTAVVPEYKAQRVKDDDAGTEMPEDLAVQLPLLNELLATAGIPIAAVAGTEADDVIASIVAQVEEPVVVVSSDRDLLSLLHHDREVAVMRPRKAGEWETLRLAELLETYGVADGVAYRQLAALRGDPADGLAGVPGIGEKTAAKLLLGYGDLAGVFGAAEAGTKDHGMSEKRRASLLAAREAVERNHTVMTCLEDLEVLEFVSAAGSPADSRTVTEAAARHSVARSAERLLSALAAGTAGPAASRMQQSIPASAVPAESWTRAPIWGFDLETTGVDPHSARIVSAALVRFEGTQPVQTYEWLVDPGIDIPAASVEIHGITTSLVRESGSPLAAAVPELLAAIKAIQGSGGVLIGHNVVYDLTVLQQESERLEHRPSAREACPHVADTFVIDKQVDRYRRGSRVLTSLCERWGVELDNAHNATADAIAAVRIALAMAAENPQLARLSGHELHAAQVSWKREQAASLQKYLRSRSRPEAVVNGDWPFES